MGRLKETYIMRNTLNYGFKAYTGKVWSDSQVDSYNAVQRNINSFITGKLPVPDYLLNGSHNLMVTYSII